MSLLKNDKASPRRKGRLLKSIIGFIVAAATLMTGTVSANATQYTRGTGDNPLMRTQEQGNPGYFFAPFTSGNVHVGSHATGLGIERWKDGWPVYCVEINTPVNEADVISGNWNPVADDTAKTAAIMITQNKDDLSDFTQASVAYAVHDHMDKHPDRWAIFKTQQLDGASLADVANNANVLWNKALAALPSSKNPQDAYQRNYAKGIFHAGIKNQSGQFVSGLTYKLTDVNNVIHWDATGSNQITVNTDGTDQGIPWTAVADGQMHVIAEFDNMSARRLTSSGQELFTMEPNSFTQDDAGSFPTEMDFQPVIETDSSPHRIEPSTNGNPQQAVDKVTMKATQGSWTPNTSVKVHGYFFTGQKEIIYNHIQRNPGENATAYLARVRTAGATLTDQKDLTFTGDNQSQTVSADIPGGSNGRFGTWVWLLGKS